VEPLFHPDSYGVAGVLLVTALLPARPTVEAAPSSLAVA